MHQKSRREDVEEVEKKKTTGTMRTKIRETQKNHVVVRLERGHHRLPRCGKEIGTRRSNTGTTGIRKLTSRTGIQARSNTISWTEWMVERGGLVIPNHKRSTVVLTTVTITLRSLMLRKIHVPFTWKRRREATGQLNNMNIILTAWTA
jgi:hypothetical protein